MPDNLGPIQYAGATCGFNSRALDHMRPVVLQSVLAADITYVSNDTPADTGIGLMLASGFGTGSTQSLWIITGVLMVFASGASGIRVGLRFGRGLGFSGTPAQALTATGLDSTDSAGLTVGMDGSDVGDLVVTAQIRKVTIDACPVVSDNGRLSVYAAQGTSDAASTIIYAGSWLRAEVLL